LIYKFDFHIILILKFLKEKSKWENSHFT